MKDLDQVKQDMSALYDDLRAGKIKREEAAELANIAGKILKAQQLQLAERIFLEQFPERFVGKAAIASKRRAA